MAPSRDLAGFLRRGSNHRRGSASAPTDMKGLEGDIGIAYEGLRDNDLLGSSCERRENVMNCSVSSLMGEFG